MRPVRRGLFLALLPTAAWAEVCDKERPFWDGTPVTMMDEAIALFATAPALILIFATLLVLRFRHMWGGLFVVLAWSSLSTAVMLWDPTGLTEAAMIEGCKGDPALFIAAVIAICIVILLLTGPKRAPKTNGDS